MKNSVYTSYGVYVSWKENTLVVCYFVYRISIENNDWLTFDDRMKQ